ncbi:MAG: 1,4-alpha-glucan branching protein GlgB [Lachnospiraceae bacterium]|nr:1,4-alpha-glucan branching protein GlgB [Lachnospiraceae bacterium]MDE6254196.1 1,4-alpha-glucan branching protein GlgB [Lachnospiraceae bacterium]
MDDKLYGMMNWPEIEGIEYCDQDAPHKILGPHLSDEGLLIQAFLPDAKSVQVNLTTLKKSYPMKKMDDAGFFAVLIDSKEELRYKLEVEYESGEKNEYWDAYEFEPTVKIEELRKFNAGICYDAYKILGAHSKRIGNVQGTEFNVWAPFALRVSVVGNFNNWDGRYHQMSRIEDTGVFSIFIPGIKEGELYKFEIKKKGDENILKTDPYAYAYESGGEGASIVAEPDKFKWNDSKWMTERKKKDADKSPISIYELHLPSWRKKDEGLYTLKELAPMITEYVSNMGYTHVELMPVMKSGEEDKLGFASAGFYAVDDSIGSYDELMTLINELHKKDIGVILDWTPNQFSSDKQGMKNFDGSCLYEHEEFKKGVNPRTGTFMFNYARPEVTSFLIANAMYWVDVFHADGLRINSVASMLYLDYDRQPGEWIPNIYGSNENLDAIEFFKHLNSIFRKISNGAIIIAEDNSGYPELTGEVTESCAGFNFKWNEEWRKDIINYMGVVPYLRNNHYNEVSLSMIYQYADNFIVGFPHLEVWEGKSSIIGKMTGDTEERKFANLRALYGYMYVHPGKKMMFMGQDFAQYNTWDSAGSLEWNLLDEDKHKKLNDYVKELNKLYKSHPALYELDNNESGFEWINNISARESILVFVRKGTKPNDMLIVVCNFDDVDREDYKIGVPAAGKYKEIFNSDKTEFGGRGFVNPRLKQSKTDECDGRAESVRINVPALGISVLKYSNTDEKVSGNSGAKANAAKSSKTSTAKKAKSSAVATKAIKEEKEEKAKTAAKEEKSETAAKDTKKPSVETKVKEDNTDKKEDSK